MKYALVDAANTYFRARHVASRNNDAWEKVGMALHLSLSSINQVVRKFGADHVVIALEGRSWRKDFYKQYKANRAVAKTIMTLEQQEEDKMFWETYEAFINFLREKTNVSVLREPNAEADDLIARFIHLHPNDKHCIISSDSDYVQLINENVLQYNGITNELITIDGYFKDNGKPVIDKKTKKPKLLGDPQYLLFKKCMRGDSTDYVFSAYPGVREKSSKNKVGLLEAYADINSRGFKWNNMMLQRWIDHKGVEQQVRNCYERNRILIDLTAQPEEIKSKVDNAIRAGVRVNKTSQVGIHLLRFCAKYDLNKIADQADTYSKWLNNSYGGNLGNE